MTWLREAWDGAQVAGAATWDAVVDLVTSPTGLAFLGVWAVAFLGGYLCGRADRRERERKASRPAHGRRAAR